MKDIDYAETLRLIRQHMQPGDTLGTMFLRAARALEAKAMHVGIDPGKGDDLSAEFNPSGHEEQSK